MSGNSNDLYNAFNTGATSQATAGVSPAFRGPYGQNGVTTRQSPPTSGEHEAYLAKWSNPFPHWYIVMNKKWRGNSGEKIAQKIEK